MEKPTAMRNEGAVEAVTVKGSGSNGCRLKTRAEEYAMLADLTAFDNLRAMIEGEAFMKRNRKIKTRRRRKKKKKQPQLYTQQQQQQQPVPEEEAGRDEAVIVWTEESKMDLIEISDDDEPLKLDVDTAVDKGKMIETVQAVKSGDECNGDEDGAKAVIDLCSSSSSEDDGLLSNMVSAKAIVNEDCEAVRGKKLKAVLMEETVDAGNKKMQAESAKRVETVKSTEPKSAQNLVLRKLLRKPRYFDPPTGGWGTCLSCGGDHPANENCKLQKRVKPCFICGALQHTGKHCVLGKFCYVCGGRGHQANDCLNKQEKDILTYTICLRCGDNGHDMFSCRSDYSPDDLKNIQCYSCKGYGHLSCVNVPDPSRTEVSCYNCGHCGHLGSECTKFPKFARGSNAYASCYRCGEEGHFTRTCTLSRKQARRMRAEMRRSLGPSSAPPPNLSEPQNGAKGGIQERLIIHSVE